MTFEDLKRQGDDIGDSVQKDLNQRIEGASERHDQEVEPIGEDALPPVKPEPDAIIAEAWLDENDPERKGKNKPEQQL